MHPKEGTARHGMGDGEINLVFYVDGRSISGRDHEWDQNALNVTVDMFRRMGLETNLKKNQGDGVYPRVHMGEVGGFGI